jgi:putative spermidine/putrescine transport system ATP-binding protein
MAHLDLRSIWKSFGAVNAVAEVSFELERGEFLSLLGPSGCGKTTTLRMVAGLERPDRGSIYLDGKDITDLPARRRGMGMVFQSYALFPNMTARENIAYGLRIRRLSGGEIARRVDKLVAITRLDGAADRYPHQISGGQQQRAALARALAIEPDVLLLDEPLSALDASVRIALRAEIRRVQQEFGISAIYVTHDQEEALSISDRIAVMSNGRIEQLASPEEIYHRPETEFIASFVGLSNRLAATVGDKPGTVVWQSQPIGVPSLGGLRPGTPITLVVRPERVAVARLGSDEGLQNGAYPGTVIARTFLGPTTRFLVRVGDAELTVDMGAEGSALRADDRISVSIDGSACFVVRGSAGAPADEGSPPHD